METRAATLEFYRTNVQKVFSFLGTRADLPITELSREDVLAFRTHLAETVATRIANHHLKTLKMIFKAARRTAFWPMTQPSSF